MRGVKPHLVVSNENPLPAASSAPDWMSVEAREEWDRVYPIVAVRRVLTAADMASLENYCTAVGRSRQLERAIQRAGDDLDLKMIRMQDKSMSTARQLAVEIGLTPSARSRSTFREQEEGSVQNDLFSQLDL
ncbi:phage terminase small subunit P27 family [Aureimonas sp. AU12]|uniref:phage terminase small subunit P27 family n=1 Tax=Aureimonas sp. AU12 TaxID=1638161 RepID=UPI000781AD5C|nr:phage terminase small subunit P27 family [Aureimonas sp. AU12]